MNLFYHKVTQRIDEVTQRPLHASPALFTLNGESGASFDKDNYSYFLWNMFLNLIVTSLMFHIFEIINSCKIMKELRLFMSKLILVVILAFGFMSPDAFSQTVVGLDNWFNSETNAKTSKPFHYLWSDTASSGYSRWGEIFKGRGAQITTVGKPSSGVLEKINIYIIVDPDTTTETPYPNYISTADIKAIKSWVKKGGILAVLANDAPNCEFTHLNQLMSEFGMSFNHVTLHPVTGTNFEMGACVNLPEHPLFKGVSKIYIKEVSDINLSGTATAVLTENGKVLMGENRYGKGYVFAIGDPWIYNEYIDHDKLPESFENRKAAENLSDLLLGNVKKK
jgi:hypothetical protein